jgi:hypothetical protein
MEQYLANKLELQGQKTWKLKSRAPPPVFLFQRLFRLISPHWLGVKSKIASETSTNPSGGVELLLHVVEYRDLQFPFPVPHGREWISEVFYTSKSLQLVDT